MITQLDTNQLEDFIGRPIDKTDYWPPALLVEKVSGRLSEYVIPGKTEIVLFKCEHGLQINLADVEVKDLNFALKDDLIKRIIIQKLRHRQAHPQPNPLLTLGMIFFCFVADAGLNDSRMGYFPLILGLLLGLTASIFRNFGNKLSIAIEFESTTGTETLILSANRKRLANDFFKRYYSSKLFQ